MKTVILCWAMMSLVLAVGVLGCSGSSEANDAKDRCTRYVTEKLKSPSTAKFVEVRAMKTDLTDSDVSFMKSEFPAFEASGVTAVYSVFGSLDSQNVYGAMIRSNYECRAIYQSGGFSDASVNVWDN
jgi:hypothetical protein